MKEEASEAHPYNKYDDGTLEAPGAFSGKYLRLVALRREQWEQLESNHHENQAMGKEGEASHRHHKQIPQKRSVSAVK
jgi:hypothetical protein